MPCENGGFCWVAQRMMAVGLAMAVAWPTSVLAQTATKGAGLAGVVRDTADQPLPLVTVVADGKDLSDVTDKDGRFFIGGLPAGPNDFTLMRIGYRQMSFTATLTTDSTLMIAVRMRRVASLEAVSITAPRAVAALKRAGFYDRERAGLGRFITPQHVDSMAPLLDRAAQLLRDTPGVEVSCSTGGCTIHTRRAHDCLKLFVDGSEMPGVTELDEVVPITEVGAMELFANPNSVPTEFQGRLPPKRGLLTAKAGCGALVVWTRARLGKI